LAQMALLVGKRRVSSAVIESKNPKSWHFRLLFGIRTDLTRNDDKATQTQKTPSKSGTLNYRETIAYDLNNR
jgi:hypothetical protein